MKKKLIFVFVIFIAIGIGLFYLLTMGNIGVKYETAEVVKSQVSQYVQDVGTVSSKYIRTYYGKGGLEVIEMSLMPGDHVEKGQLLVRYEDNSEQIDLQIMQVEKQIEALQASYEEAQSSTDMGSVSNARVEIASIKRQIETAGSDLEKLETLFAEGVVTKNEVEQSAIAIEQLENNLSIAQNTYNQLVRGISEHVRERYEAEIDALLIAIDILDNSRVDNSVYSDIDGIVTELNTYIGDQPSMGTAIIELYDPTAKVLLVDFMVEDALEIEEGMSVEIADDALDIYIDNLVVNRIYPKAFVTLSELGVEENRQTVAIELPTGVTDLDFGVEVTGKVMIEAPREVHMVPAGAIIEKDSKAYVKVLEGETVTEKEVITRQKTEQQVVVEGLVEGEQVILNYQED